MKTSTLRSIISCAPSGAPLIKIRRELRRRRKEGEGQPKAGQEEEEEMASMSRIVWPLRGEICGYRPDIDKTLVRTDKGWVRLPGYIGVRGLEIEIMVSPAESELHKRWLEEGSRLPKRRRRADGSTVKIVRV